MATTTIGKNMRVSQTLEVKKSEVESSSSDNEDDSGKIDCNICCEEVYPRNMVACPFCDHTACQECTSRFLLETQVTLPMCMAPGCKKNWSLEYIASNFPPTFHNSKYRNHRTQILFEQEMSMLPGTQSLVMAEKKKIKRKTKIKKLQDENAMLEQLIIQNKRKINQYHIKNRGDLGEEKEKKEKNGFTRACPVEDCRGFLSSRGKCGTCSGWACMDCRLAKNGKDDEKHECNPDTVATYEMLAKDTKSCPSCGTMIYKIHGCFSADTKIILWNGKVKVAKDILIGDELIGDDGEKRTVYELLEGEDDMYRIKQNKADDYIVNSKHDLVLKAVGHRSIYPFGDRWKIKWFDHDEYCYRTKVCESKIEADNLHNLIGESNIVKIPVSVYINLSQSTRKALVGFRSPGVNWSSQPVKIDPYILGMSHKHIPSEYMVNDRKIRLEVLAGVIDTRGYVSNDGTCVTISRMEPEFLDQIIFLARSLGFITNYDERKEINISGILSDIPTKIKMKCVDNKDYYLTGITVEPVEKSKYYGWRIDGNKRFVLPDFTVVKNCDQMYCQSEDTEIWMWNGSKKLARDIIIGDILIGEDGNPRKVETMTRGEDELFEVEQRFGSNYKVIGKHLLTLINNDKMIDISVNDYMELKKTRGYHRTACKQINWEFQQVKLDPYILGSWLGDGTSRGDGFASNDPVIIMYWVDWALKNNGEVVHGRPYGYDVRGIGQGDRKSVGYGSMNECIGCVKQPSLCCASVDELEKSTDQLAGIILKWKQSLPTEYVESTRGKKRIKSPLKIFLDRYNLLNNKRIPLEYIRNNRETRLQVLAGIIDTDGNLHRNSYRISQSVERYSLCKDIKDLVHSLGFSTTEKYFSPGLVKFSTHGKSYNCKDSVNIRIMGQTENIPVKLSYKKATGTKRTTSTIKISNIGKGKYIGWSISGGSPRYLLGDGTITHNCTQCHTAFSWLKGTIEKGVIHNPHYYEIQRTLNGGVAPRARGDMRCGGMPDLWMIVDKIKKSGVVFPQVYEIYQLWGHINDVELPRFPNVLGNQDNSDLRVKYLMNEIDQSKWKTDLKRRAKTQERNMAFNQVLTMFSTMLTALMSNIVDDIENIPIYITSFSTLREYTNKELSKVGFTFGNLYPYISDTWDYHRNSKKVKSRLVETYRGESDDE